MKHDIVIFCYESRKKLYLGSVRIRILYMTKSHLQQYFSNLNIAKNIDIKFCGKHNVLAVEFTSESDC